jgi:hypothetical protein
MAKFYGIVGYIETVETKPGIWKPVVTEKTHKGDFVRNAIQFKTSGDVNDNVDITNEISIVANPFARDNFHLIRYVVYKGVKWKVDKVDTSHPPRLILSIGGVYNGDE